MRAVPRRLGHRSSAATLEPPATPPHLRGLRATVPHLHHHHHHDGGSVYPNIHPSIHFHLFRPGGPHVQGNTPRRGHPTCARAPPPLPLHSRAGRTDAQSEGTRESGGNVPQHFGKRRGHGRERPVLPQGWWVCLTRGLF
uniref:Uncharacterized protein n=1 Tax=Sus scrofa TaxID=9823 RepID=A0A4X1VAI0_PIG